MKWVLSHISGVYSLVSQILSDRDDDHDSFNHAFFVLDAHLKPIKVISLFLVPEELTASIGKPKYNVVLRDLIGTTNPDVEPFEFMI